MITSLNKELEGSDMEGKMLLVGSLDVKALYPSLKIEKTCGLWVTWSCRVRSPLK